MAGTLLTAHQVQDLLGVDASTVYRMAGDGRLPAVRVGRQWRFRPDQIDALLGTSGSVETAVTADEGRPPALPSQAVLVGVLEAVAPALGASMVVTGMDGRPLTPVVNPAPAIAARITDPGFFAECTAEWRAFAAEPDLVPRLRPGRQGFLCAHALVRSGPALVAMVLAGGVADDRVSAPGFFQLDAERREAVVATLPRVATLLSRLMANPSSEHV